MEYHDPLNAGLVLPFQCPRDGRSTLPVLPSLPQLGLLRCREPNPRRHHGTPPHLVRLEGVAWASGRPTGITIRPPALSWLIRAGGIKSGAAVTIILSNGAFSGHPK